MRRPVSLTARLVATAVLLVAAVCLCVGTATSVLVRGQLLDQLDAKLEQSSRRAGPGLPELRPHGQDDHGPRGDFGNQEPGTLIAVMAGTATSGQVLGDRPDEEEALSAAQLDALAAVGEGAHAVEIPGLGNYRVLSVSGGSGQVVTGLPTRDLDETVGWLIGSEALLSLLAVAAAAGVGTALVRRQLRPLRDVAATAHEVAELPLSTGAISLDARVPTALTDERTEVGQVGAALNTMLDHVASSLEARHRSEQQVRQFLADASHELRTPLTTIAGYTELARNRPDDLAASETALAKVEEESARMKALVEDMLLLARLDAGRPLAHEQVDLSRLLIEAVSDARVVAPGHHWRLELPNDAVEVVGDEQRLHQVVTNLLTNARNYTPEGTTVTVRTEEGGFSVHDDGPGFPPDLIGGRAFERFTRGDAARTRSQGGTGLGLALVRAIVSAHGGDVGLVSEPGSTTISVWLTSPSHTVGILK